MRIEESIEFIKIHESYFFSLNNLDLIILRGHLLIEDKIFNLIKDFVFHKNFITKARLSFYQSVNIVKSMSFNQSSNKVWLLIEELNRVRNQLAHMHPSAKNQLDLEKIKALYHKEVDGTEFENEWGNQGEISGMKSTIGLCLGFLFSFGEEIKILKQFITSMDQIISQNSG